MRPDSSVHWSAYPALLLAALLTGSIVTDDILASSMSPLARMLLWGGCVVLGLGMGALSIRRARGRLVTLSTVLRVGAVAACVVGVGGIRHSVYVTPSTQNISALADLNSEDKLSTICGQTVDMPTQHPTSETRRFTLRATHARIGDDPSRVGAETEETQPNATGRIRVTLYDAPWTDAGPFPNVRQGDVLCLQGRVQTVGGPRNPGAFDYAAYLARRGVYSQMFVDTPAHVQLRGDQRTAIGDAVVRARTHVRTSLDQYVTAPTSRSILRALLLGDRSGVTDATRSDFAVTGLMHLLAVSGLHVMLVGMVLYGLLRPFLMRLRLSWKTVDGMRAVLTIAVLLFYMMLTGTRPSVVRAVVMTTLLIGGILFQRSSHTLNTLGVAAVVLLLLRPPMLFDVGFQLSLSAVAGIVTLHPHFQSWLPDAWRDRPAVEWLTSTTSVSIAATLGTAPILVWHFGGVSIGGILLNTAAIPFTAVGLTAGILTVTLGAILPQAGLAFGAAADLFIQALTWTATVGASTWDGGYVRTGQTSFRLPIALGILCVLLVQWPRPRTRWALVAVLVGLGTVTVAADVVTNRSGPSMDVLFFDIGQGDATLVTFPNGRRMLVDTGPRTRYRDAAARTILPYLERNAISRLDLVVVTHPDSDHLGGLPSLLRSVDVGRVVHSGRSASSHLYAESRQLLDSTATSNSAVVAGDTLHVDSSVRIDVLGPPGNGTDDSLHGENDASVVLRLTYGSVDVLLTGDVEEAGEAFLVETYGRWMRSEIVKAAHHGSSTSSSPHFVDAVRQDELTVVIPVGRRNAYGMPDGDVVRRWAEVGTVFSTGADNAVWLRTNGKSVSRVLWNESPSHLTQRISWGDVSGKE